VINDNGMDAQIDQTALDGSTVSATAELEIGSYAISSVTSATASANAYDAVSYGGENNHALRQDSGADVSADSYVLAPTGGLGYAATVLGAANGNSAQIQGYYMGPDQIADIDQDNRGSISARARAESGGGAVSETVTASANGNSVWMQNENGYAHIQGTQDNSGTVTADAYAQAGDFDIDLVAVSSEGAMSPPWPALTAMRAARPSSRQQPSAMPRRPMSARNVPQRPMAITTRPIPARSPRT
jgi:hypothetical protein